MTTQRATVTRRPRWEAETLSVATIVPPNLQPCPNPCPIPCVRTLDRMLTLLNDTARSAVSVGNLRTLVLGDKTGDSGALSGDCGRDVGIGRIRANRCGACFEYRRRTSVERPSELWKTK